MANENQLSTVPVPVLNRSAFDKSHQNLLTMKVGTLTPVLVDELIPDSTIDLKATMMAKLPPLASDTFMRVKMHVEAFFVPYRILYAGFGEAMSGGHGVDLSDRVTMPAGISATFSSFADFKAKFGPGTLPDYLGFKLPTGNLFPTSSTGGFRMNLFPFLAYHRLWHDWYRNPMVQKPVFVPGTTEDARYLPYAKLVQSYDNAPGGIIFSSEVHIGDDYNITGYLNDGVDIGALRQRNWGHDYFTSATPTPTIGTMPTLVVNSTVNGSTATGDFTIGALRAINSMTQFAERNALAGVRYDDWLRANYGVHLSSDIEGRAKYLGRMVFDIYSKGVTQTGTSVASSVATQNPFQSVGAQYGEAVGVAENSLCQDFYVQEPGLLMVIASIVPRPTYSTGAARYLRHFTKDGFRADLANQIFENVGPQPIFKSELDGNALFSNQPDDVFGYTDRFAEWKTKFDELHGLMRDGESLESFALQRSVGLAGASMNSSFLQIPDTYLDQVAAVSGDISKYGAWLDCYFDYKVVQPLSRYSIPSLIMPAEHGSKSHTVEVRRSGSHL